MYLSLLKPTNMKQLLSLVCFNLFSLMSFAQTEAEMKAWQAFMTPGDMHKQLALGVGSWKMEIIMWMAPGTNPIKSTGTAQGEMILGDRYFKQTFKGDFMGMPMEGYSMTAYDNGKKQFIATWIDNMGTGMMITEGKWNPVKKAIEMRGKQTDPMTGKDCKIRETLTFQPDGSQFLEMWMEQNGKEFKTMEIRFSRA